MFFFFFNEKSEAFFWGFDQFFVSKVFSKHVFLGGICTFPSLFWWWENGGIVLTNLKFSLSGLINVFVTLDIIATNGILCYGSTKPWILCVLKHVIFYFNFLIYSYFMTRRNQFIFWFLLLCWALTSVKPKKEKEKS